MNKTRKRISKILKKKPKDALVIGKGFGTIEILLEMFDTVFVFSKSPNDVKAPNLVFKKSIEDTFHLADVTAIFIDRDYVKALDLISPVMQKVQPEIFIEGNEVIHRDQTVNL